jgi:MYXO-CTERM domain-containing protein
MAGVSGAAGAAGAAGSDGIEGDNWSDGGLESGTGGSGAAGGASGQSTKVLPDDNGGCGCGTTGRASRPWFFALLASAALLSRRRLRVTSRSPSSLA